MGSGLARGSIWTTVESGRFAYGTSLHVHAGSRSGLSETIIRHYLASHLRKRTTFADEFFSVRSAHEILCYGPETARAVAFVASMPEWKNYIYCRKAIRDLVRHLGCDMRMFHEKYPDYRERRASYRSCDLYRTGFTIIRHAAEVDTDCYFSSRNPPFEVCHTPLEAYFRYRDKDENKQAGRNRESRTTVAS